MPQRFPFFFSPFLILLFACASAPQNTPPLPSPTALKNTEKEYALNEATALQRANSLENVRYELEFKFVEDLLDFSGQAKINFSLKLKPETLALDFRGSKVSSLTINGNPALAPLSDNQIPLPVDQLKIGENEVIVEYQSSYTVFGGGLHRFSDPEDQRVYLHSDFEPFSANKVFPCFDQPDLKATFDLKVEAPKEWLIASAAPEKKIKAVAPQPVKGGEEELPETRIWEFQKTAPISTYLFSIVAGPYMVWNSTAGDIPLRLYSRRSLSRYVEPSEWFRITKAGLKFYQKFFGITYPFKKLDLVIAPDFVGFSAMENVAAITFAERFAPRTTMVRQARRERAGVILHEVAHQWFGDLVTPRWWNDLWLNESFATYMGTLALAEATEFTEAWHGLYGVKQGTYLEDEEATTHPISAHVQSTSDVAVLFDHITYVKGAAAIKQLSFFIGVEKFKQGVQAYLKDHALKNAELKDFIEALEKSSGMPLQEWARLWLSTSGVNHLEAQTDCMDGKITHWSIKQTDLKTPPTLRPQRVLISLFGLHPKTNKPQLLQKTEVSIIGPEAELPELTGKTCPAFTLINEQDQDYAQINWNDISILFIREHAAQFDDPFVRKMLYQTLWSEVLTSRLSVLEYLKTAELILNHEKEEELIQPILGTLVQSLDYLTNDESDILRTDAAEKIEHTLRSLLRHAKPGGDLQKIYWDTFVDIARSSETLDELAESIEQGRSFTGFALDIDRKWKVIQQICTYDPAMCEPLREDLLKKDTSHAGLLHAISAEVSQPLLEIKEQWFNELISPSMTRKMEEYNAAMSGFFKRDQDSFKKHFQDRYFRLLPKISQSKSTEFVTLFAKLMAPTTCDEKSIDRLEAFINSSPELSPAALQSLKKTRQDRQRCLSIRKTAMAQANKTPN